MQVAIIDKIPSREYSELFEWFVQINSQPIGIAIVILIFLLVANFLFSVKFQKSKKILENFILIFLDILLIAIGIAECYYSIG
jgi:hypothetical protein